MKLQEKIKSWCKDEKFMSFAQERARKEVCEVTENHRIDPQYEELWAELLGGFAQGGGEVMSPDSTRTPTGTLQWPLPVAGTITSQFGHRVDPITGEVNSTPAQTLPVPRVRRFSLRQTASPLLPTALTVGAAATATTSKSTTAAGWKHCTPTAPPSASPPTNKCRPGRSSVMSATLGEPQAAICT